MELQLTVQIPASYFGNQITFQVYGMILLWMLIWTHHTMMNSYLRKKSDFLCFFAFTFKNENYNGAMIKKK